MNRIRVYQASKDLGLKCSEFISLLSILGVNIKGPSATIPEDIVECVSKIIFYIRHSTDSSENSDITLNYFQFVESELIKYLVVNEVSPKCALLGLVSLLETFLFKVFLFTKESDTELNFWLLIKNLKLFNLVDYEISDQLHQLRILKNKCSHEGFFPEKEDILSLILESENIINYFIDRQFAVNCPACKIAMHYEIRKHAYIKLDKLFSFECICGNLIFISTCDELILFKHSSREISTIIYKILRYNEYLINLSVPKNLDKIQELTDEEIDSTDLLNDSQDENHLMHDEDTYLAVGYDKLAHKPGCKHLPNDTDILKEVPSYNYALIFNYYFCKDCCHPIQP